MNDTDALADLRHHWGGAYKIGWRAGRWRAARRDDGSMVSADTAAGLLEQIRADYAARPVPREDNGPWWGAS